MSRFCEHLNNFLVAVEVDTARADSITEIKVKSSLFFKIANEMLRDCQDRSSGFTNSMSRDLSKVKRYKTLCSECKEPTITTKGSKREGVCYACRVCNAK